jgi:hypothetical protein
VDEESQREEDASGCEVKGHMMLVYQFLICILAWCHCSSVGGLAERKASMPYAPPLQDSLTS